MKASTKELLAKLSRLRIAPDEAEAVTAALKKAIDKIAATKPRRVPPKSDTPDFARS